MAIARKAAQAAPVSSGPSFGDLGFYSGGFTLPKGKYALEFNVLMYTPTKQDGTPAGNPRLGVMLRAHPLAGGEPQEQFVSMGTKAHLSFMPDTAGKGLVPVPGGPASTLPKGTNWMLILSSLYDCGLPQGVFTNDITVLDGVHVQTDLVPEPEERKGYGSTAATGEAAGQKEERKGSGLIPVVVEILDDGKPWEGTGGIPDASQAPTPTAAAKKTVTAAKTKPAPAPVAAPEPEGDEDLMAAAVSGITSVLEKEPNGTTKLKLRMGAFKSITASHGAEVTQAVMDAYFTSDDALNSVLGQLGYAVKGTNIVAG